MTNQRMMVVINIWTRLNMDSRRVSGGHVALSTRDFGLEILILDL